MQADLYFTAVFFLYDVVLYVWHRIYDTNSQLHFILFRRYL